MTDNSLLSVVLPLGPNQTFWRKKLNKGPYLETKFTTFHVVVHRDAPQLRARNPKKRMKRCNDGLNTSKEHMKLELFLTSGISEQTDKL